MKKRTSIGVLSVMTLAALVAAWYWVITSQSRTTVASAYPGNWIWEANSQTLDRVPPIFLLQPSTLPAGHVPFDMYGKDRYLARGKTLEELIAVVWSQKDSALKIKFDADLPSDRFDFIVADQPGWWNNLQSEIDGRFDLVEKVETGQLGKEVVVRNSGTP